MKIKTKIALTTAAYLIALSVFLYFAGRSLITSNADSIQAHFNEMPNFPNAINAELARLADLSLAAAKDHRTVEFLESAAQKKGPAVPEITAREGHVIADKQLDLFAIATIEGDILAAAARVNGEVCQVPESLFSYISPENDLILRETAAMKVPNFVGIFALPLKPGARYSQFLVSIAPVFFPSRTNSPAGVIVFGSNIDNIPKIADKITYLDKKRPMHDKSKEVVLRRPLYKHFAKKVEITNREIEGTDIGIDDSIISIPLRDLYGDSYAQIDVQYSDASRIIEKEAKARLQILLLVTVLIFFIPITILNAYFLNKAVRSVITGTTGKDPAGMEGMDAEDQIRTLVRKFGESDSEISLLRDKLDLAESKIVAFRNAVSGTLLVYRDSGEIVHSFLSPAFTHAKKLAAGIEVGKNVKEARGIKDADLKREIQLVDSAASHGGCHIIQTSITDDSNAILWFESRITRIRPGLILAIIDDITARKSAGLERSRIDEKIKDIEKAETFGVLAGGLAHDYNNMLTAMLGNIDFLLCGQLLPQTRDSLTDVRAAMIRAAALVRRMLSYAGKSGPILEDTNLCSLVSDLTRLMRRSIPDNAKIILDTPETTPVVRVDSTQMWQVLMNLIINGCDAMEGAPGTVRVSTSGQELSGRELSIYYSQQPLEPGWYACIEVEDTGKGMDDATITRIFEPFFTTKPEGKGLGLPSVIGIIYSYKGGITLRSTVGRGTVFKIVIPARLRGNGEVLLPGRLKERMEEKAKTAVPSILKADTQPLSETGPVGDIRTEGDSVAKTAEASAAAKPVAGDSILIVDDDPSILKLLKLILKSGGYSVIESSTGKEGLKTYEANASSIKLCLMDVSMGAGMSGLELCAEIRKRDPEIPVVLMSAYRAKEMSAKMSSAGVSGFLAKPFRGADVLDLVKNYLKGQAK